SALGKSALYFGNRSALKSILRWRRDSYIPIFDALQQNYCIAQNIAWPRVLKNREGKIGACPCACPINAGFPAQLFWLPVSSVPYPARRALRVITYSLRATHRDLMALGAEKLASEATLNGSAAGEIRIGQIDILKLSAGSTFALFVVFTTPSGALARRSRQATQRQRQLQQNRFLRSSAMHLHHFPFRFVWQTDAGTHFSLANQEFADLLGPRTAAVLGRSWLEIA